MISGQTRVAGILACGMLVLSSAAFGFSLAEKTAVNKPDFSRILAEGTSWTIRLPEKEHVEFKGVANFDNAGSKGAGMLYPAPNPAGFLAAVITHGILLGSTREHEKNKLQEEADKVLLPYQPILTAFTSRELMEGAALQVPMLEHAAYVNSGGENIKGNWIVSSSPVFLMTQDEKSVLLENAVSLYTPEVSDKPAYHILVRIISTPREEAEPRQFWTEEGESQIRKVSTLLVARSLQIAINDAAHVDTGSPAVFKTFRYAEGGIEKMERGQLIAESCGRALIRNLRGNLMSIPLTTHDIQPVKLEECSKDF